jgi:hypothetical protein
MTNPRSFRLPPTVAKANELVAEWEALLGEDHSLAHIVALARLGASVVGAKEFTADFHPNGASIIGACASEPVSRRVLVLAGEGDK